MDYYQVAGEASKEIGSHPGLLYIQKLAVQAKKILDVGCGEGSRLDTLLPATKSGFGIDLNSIAVSNAKKNYPHHHFQLANAAHLPFPDNSFNLVYSAFVIEHTTQPKQVISEMYRVCQTGGKVIILCPNFGAPNRRSPNNSENPFIKFLIGFIKDFKRDRSLFWKQVVPKTDYLRIDDDTTVEPYLSSLINYLTTFPITLDVVTSLWELEGRSYNPRKFIIKFLGQNKIPPFKYWGPQVFVAVTKVK